MKHWHLTLKVEKSLAVSLKVAWHDYFTKQLIKQTMPNKSIPALQLVQDASSPVLYEQLATKVLIQVLSNCTSTKNFHHFSQTRLYHQTLSEEERGCQRKPCRASSSERKKPLWLSLPAHSSIPGSMVCTEAPQGTAVAGWGGPLNGWPCVWPLEERGGKIRERERERLCGLGVKTDRLLMEASTFRCSDEVLEHAVKYSWIESENLFFILFF